MTPEDKTMSDLLSLVGLEAQPEIIATWTRTMVRDAGEWAACTHLRASDNVVKVPARPWFLPEPWTGPAQGDGIWETNPTPVGPWERKP